MTTTLVLRMAAILQRVALTLLSPLLPLSIAQRMVLYQEELPAADLVLI